MKTNTTYSTSLAARCAAVNAAHDEANYLAAALRATFAPFLGKKVVKVDGTLTAAAKAALPAPSTDCQFWHDRSDYVLRFAVKTYRQTDGGHAHYAEASVYVGELASDSGTFTLLTLRDLPIPQLRTDYSPEVVAGLRNVAETAKEAARNAESACFPFGLFDR